MKKNAIVQKVIILTVMALLVAPTGCGQSGGNTSSTDAASAGEAGQTQTEETGSEDANKSLDYLVLVNKNHPIPDTWESALDTVPVTNSMGEKVSVEHTTYGAYLKLHDQLAREGVSIEIASAFRSAEEQQEFEGAVKAETGEKAADQYVAAPGYSEHQTGLALDLYLVIDEKPVTEEAELLKYTEIWDEIHDCLAENGFILRYPEGSEEVTGYKYKPWHIRYVGTEAAQAITEQEITLEEYLDADDLLDNN